MLSRQSGVRLGIVLRTQNLAAFSTSLTRHAVQPNAPLELDPSMKALLKDANMSILNHKTKRHRSDASNASLRELELLPSEAEELEELELELDERVGRKSPAARFGSQQVGAVILPEELQDSINSIIQGLSTIWHFPSREIANLHREQNRIRRSSVMMQCVYSNTRDQKDRLGLGIRNTTYTTGLVEKHMNWENVTEQHSLQSHYQRITLPYLLS